MLDFLSQLQGGIYKKSANSKQLALLNTLLNQKIIAFHKGKFHLNNGFYFGKLDISSKGDGYLQNKNFKKDLFIPATLLNHAQLGDIVIVSKKYLRQRLVYEVKFIAFHANEFSLVALEKYGGKILARCLRTNILRPLKASQKSLKVLPAQTILKINNINNEIVEVLGTLNDPKIDELISLELYSHPKEFDKNCELEAAAYAKSVDASFYANRLDLRALPFCTIDPSDAKDFDDAIYFDEKNEILYVAIADVSEYVNAFGALDKEAFRRGFSVYFAHKSVPMLPRILSEGICSLNPNEERLAFGFKIFFDGEKVLKSEIFEALICSKARFSYEEVDEFLANKSDLKDFNFLHKLNEICKILRKKRLEIGYEFLSEEVKLVLDESTMIKSVQKCEHTASHALIEECMLLANIEAAKFAPKTAIFRNHQAINYEKLEELKEFLKEFKIKAKGENYIKKIQALADELGIREQVDEIIIRSLKKANYQSQNAGHFALGFDIYSHFTSPIRRYSDLFLHRILKAKMQKKDKILSYLSSQSEDLCAKISQKERDTQAIMRDFTKRKFARLFAQKIGEEIQVKITHSKDFCEAITLNPFGARVKLINKDLPIFAIFSAKIIKVDLINAEIYAKVFDVRS